VADFNPLAASDYSDAVRRLLGEELSLSSVSPEIGLLLALEVDRPDWHFLRNSRLFSTGILSVAALTGKVGQADLFNPTGSGVIVVCTFVRVVSPAAGVRYELVLDGGAAGGVAAQNLLLDQRYGLAARAVSQNFIGNGAVGPSGNEVEGISPSGSTTGDVTFEIPRKLGIIVAPGRRINLFTSAQNTALQCFFGGYERRARPEELAV
jgi:hypothetical protein